MPPKKLVMKSYSTTFLLEKALDIPEFSLIKDPRDIDFKKSWTHKHKNIIKALPEDNGKELVKKLFAEVFAERKIAEDISPKLMPYLYNPSLRPVEDVTIVYVPGIYNSIFDNEIFRMGLDHIKNNLGLRVIAAPVFSSCSSNYNGDIILDFLKKDEASRASRGLSKTKYFLFGYSKGGMDSLHAFTKDPEFVRENVHGLLTIASPLQGTTILNKSDLPLDIPQTRQ